MDMEFSDHKERTATIEDLPEFPIKPFLDKVIVREIPVEEFYRQSEDVFLDLDNKHVKIESDRGIVVSVSRQFDWDDAEVKVGDVVRYDEFGRTDPIYLNPADKNRTDLPKYFQMRLGDLKGRQI